MLTIYDKQQTENWLTDMGLQNVEVIEMADGRVRVTAFLPEVRGG